MKKKLKTFGSILLTLVMIVGLMQGMSLKAYANTPSHTHDFTYSAEGATLTATCTADDCNLTEKKVSLTLAVISSELDYSGSPQGACLNDSEKTAWTEAGLTVPTIEYEGRESTSYVKSTTAPTDAGTYTASITAGMDATATVDFSISKANPTAAAPTVLPATYGQTLADVTLTNPVGNTPGTWTWVDDGYTSVGDVGQHAFVAKFTPEYEANYYDADAEVIVTVEKAYPAVTAPTANTGLTYTGSTQELVTAGSTNGGTMYYALVANNTGAPAADAYTTSIPKALNAGEYKVYYKIKGDKNHLSQEGESVGTVTIGKKSADIINLKTIEVQKGTNVVEVSVNLKSYRLISITGFTPVTTSGNVNINNNYDFNPVTGILKFGVSSEDGGNATITLTGSSANVETLTLNIPVEVKAKTAEVKLEDPDSGSSVTSDVQGVEADGLSAYTQGQVENAIVLLAVKPVSEPTSDDDKQKIENCVINIFKGFNADKIKKEYLDIKITKQVVGASSVSIIDDVERPLRLAIKYDLSGKFNPVVIREHEHTVKAFTRLKDNPGDNPDTWTDATYYVDEEHGVIYIYTRFFSTYSIAYATANSHTVTFFTEGGSEVPPIVVPDGAMIGSLPTSSRDGYSFDGWYTEQHGVDMVTEETIITGDTKFFAHWTEITTPPAPTYCTVMFDLNGHGTAIAPQSVESGQKAARPADPEAEGFEFGGWYTDKECTAAYDFDSPVREGLGLYAKWTEKKPEPPEPEPEPAEGEKSIWNLFESEAPHTYTVKGVSGNEIVANSNAKSSVFFDAELKGNVISVSLKSGADRKKASQAANSKLTFLTSDGKSIEYALPVTYAVPSLKLTQTGVTIKSGSTKNIELGVLREQDGGYTDLDLSDAEVKYNGTAAQMLDNGKIGITVSAAGKCKVSIKKKGWEKAIELIFSVKNSKKDVLSVDLNGAKSVVLNSNAPAQSFSFPVYLNGEKAGNDIKLTDKKNSGVASYADGTLTIAYPKDGVKTGSYTIVLSTGESACNVKVTVSKKDLHKSINLKIKDRYDVVTLQPMLIEPIFKDVYGTIEAVEVDKEGFTANLDASGKIAVRYEGKTYDIKNLNIGDMNFRLKISGIEEPITCKLKNVKAKKTALSLKASDVTVPKDAAGDVIALANIVCTYKDSMGKIRYIQPVSSTIGRLSGVTAEVSAKDPTDILINSLSKKSGTVKVTLTFNGGYTKTVTIHVKQAK